MSYSPRKNTQTTNICHGRPKHVRWFTNSVGKFLRETYKPNHDELKKKSPNTEGIVASLSTQDRQFTPHYPLQKL
jgi:hypothetical protein